ncbi:hypothetical protein OKA04_00565 [Luteolibacter flavescens]|uniref:Lipase helper protein n=1 Tax=Luteolibacter flavescens TaxID=1859460 RepID=A0ABT3FI19_9BACT|nr:hypothetical protein [Luteolibacter flavescens]MCW1883200.1 hypothetical protein [Luteolibacter flavescens]
MKSLPTLGLVIAAVAVTLVIEESRISSLRRELEEARKPPTHLPTTHGKTLASASVTANGQTNAPTKAGDRRAQTGTSSGVNEEMIAKSVRKMWDLPAGKAMMNQGVKTAVVMMYEDYIDTLGLTKDETDYFRTLLGQEMADQQELGMKMANATPEEREAMARELEERKKANEETITTFLNSEEDSKRLADYKNRIPERQQLDGIRATFGAKNAALDKAAEGKLVDALYQARITSPAVDAAGDGGLVTSFERHWESQEQALMKEAATFLDEPQLAALKDYRQQLKEMQLVNLEMTEKMMSEGDLEDDEE